MSAATTYDPHEAPPVTDCCGTVDPDATLVDAIGRYACVDHLRAYERELRWRGALLDEAIEDGLRVPEDAFENAAVAAWDAATARPTPAKADATDIRF